MSADETLEQRALEYLDTAFDTLKDLSSAQLGEDGLKWDGVAPSDFKRVALLESNIRDKPVIFGAKPVDRHPEFKKDSVGLLKVFLREYSDEKDANERTSDRMLRERNELRSKLTRGPDPLQKDVEDAVRKHKELIPYSGTSTSGDVFLTQAQDALNEAISMVDREVGPAVNKSQTWWNPRTWGQKPPSRVKEWSFDKARDPWIESMNTLISIQETPFEKNDMPLLREVELREGATARTEKIKAMRVVVLSRSERHLNALKEIIYLSMLRVDFGEGGRVIRLKKDGLDSAGRNVTRALKTLYFGLIEFSKVSTAAQDKAIIFMDAVADMTLTL